MTNKLENLGFDYPIISQKNKTLLKEFGPRAEDDYRKNKQHLLEWLLKHGKNQFKEQGYSPETVRKSHYKIDKTYRWVWKDKDRYCWRFEPERASEYLDYMLKYQDQKEPQIVEYKKAIKLLFRYWNETTDSDIDWEYSRELKANYDTERAHFRPNELRALYEATLSYNTIRKPTDSEKVEELKGLLARRFDTPTEQITEDDFNRANSWKIPSLVGMSNDLGLRPREIEIARASWIDTDNNLVRIPTDQAVKSSSSWTCALSDQTSRALQRWLTERSTYGIYDDTNRLWLNDSGKPYNNQSVNYLLDNLVPEAGIEPNHRNLTWYSIRHGVATMWANEEGVHYAQEQLRHEKPETTMGYVHTDKTEQVQKADKKW